MMDMVGLKPTTPVGQTLVNATDAIRFFVETGAGLPSALRMSWGTLLLLRYDLRGSFDDVAGDFVAGIRVVVDDKLALGHMACDGEVAP